MPLCSSLIGHHFKGRAKSELDAKINYQIMKPHDSKAFSCYDESRIDWHKCIVEAKDVKPGTKVYRLDGHLFGVQPYLDGPLIKIMPP
jgi:hypothetical protein